MRHARLVSHREIEKKQHEDDLAKAQKLADGKLRNKRGEFDLDDDEWDDDYGVSRGRADKRQRVDGLTTKQLSAWRGAARHIVRLVRVLWLTRLVGACSGERRDSSVRLRQH